MRFKNNEEASLWAESHSAYIMHCERRVRAVWGVYYTQRELCRSRGNARIAGYGRGKRLLAWIDIEAHAPLPNQKSAQEGAIA